MAYVIAAILVVMLVGGFVAFLVMNASKRSGPSTADEGGPPGIGRDDTPLGDTAEHAGTHDGSGETVADPEPREPAPAEPAPADPDAAAHRARPGEAEGGERLDFEGERPASRRVAGRDG